MKIYPYHLVTLSGPQGCGKSTTLHHVAQICRDRKLPIHVDGFKVSRHVQAEIGMENLSDALVDYESMMDFQSKIVSTRTDYEEGRISTHKIRAPEGTKIVIMERSYADIVAYFRLWSEIIDPTDYFSFARELFISSTREQYEFVSHHLYLPFMDHIKFEYDPNRGFEGDIIKFDNLLKDELNHSSIGINKSTITGTTPTERAESLLKQLEHLL